MRLDLLFLFLFTSLSLPGCASFESRFTSQTGCPEEDILVIKRSHNIFGNQSYTVACHGRKFYCTEDFVEGQHSNLKCSSERKRRHPSSESDDDSDSDESELMSPAHVESNPRQWYRY